MARTTSATYRINLVDKHDARSSTACAIEQLAHAGGTSTYEELDKLCSGNTEKRQASIGRASPCEQRLPTARRSNEKNAPRNTRPEGGKSTRIAHDLDYLLHLLLCSVDASNVCEMSEDIVRIHRAAD
jgi:hypothetical protein